MRNTFEAVLRGNELEWHGEAPDGLSESNPVRVSVTLLESTASQGGRMTEALEKLAGLKVRAEIPDPAVWERQQRAERPFPDRPS